MASNASVPLIMRVLASSAAVVSRAGIIIRDIMSGGELGIVEKAVNDLQTEADRSAERLIVASLARQFPTLTVIGEEGEQAVGLVPDDLLVTDYDSEVIGTECPADLANVTLDDLTVWVDPLDGTGEYTEGHLDHVTVLVGIANRGRPIAGVIHQPYYDYQRLGGASSKEVRGRTLWGIVGGRVGGFEVVEPPAGKLIVVATRSHSDKYVASTLDALAADEIIHVGGAGYKVLMLIEGKAHAYVHASPGCKRWDTCAPEAILRAMGGRLTDVHGNHYSYEASVARAIKFGLIATGPGVDHDAIINKIPVEVKDHFK